MIEGCCDDDEAARRLLRARQDLEAQNKDKAQRMPIVAGAVSDLVPDSLDRDEDSSAAQHRP